eukprot:1158591-Pelagomonas_calceolata.AAC.1
MSGRAGFEPLVVREGKSFMLFPEVETGCAAYYRALPCNDSCVARFTRHHNVSKGDGEVRRRWSSFNCPSAIIVTASIYRSSTPKLLCNIKLGIYANLARKTNHAFKLLSFVATNACNRDSFTLASMGVDIQRGLQAPPISGWSLPAREIVRNCTKAYNL